MPSCSNQYFLTPLTSQLLFGFCYPRFVGNARDVGRTCGDVENDAGDVDGLQFREKML